MERSPSLASTNEIQCESDYESAPTSESDYESASTSEIQNESEYERDNSIYIMGYFLDDITEYIECEKACNTYDVKR